MQDNSGIVAYPKIIPATTYHSHLVSLFINSGRYRPSVKYEKNQSPN
jgi:hypothetical protein